MSCGRSGPDPAQTAIHAVAHAGVVSLLTLIFGITAVAGEYRHQTITDTYLATPRRGRVIAAKFAVYTAVGAVFGLMLAITAVIATAVAITANGGSLDLSNRDLWRTLAGGVACNAAFAAIGVSLGALIPNLAAAITALAWIALVEGLIGELIPDLEAWLPFRRRPSARPPARHPDISQWAGGLLLAGYTVVFRDRPNHLYTPRHHLRPSLSTIYRRRTSTDELGAWMHDTHDPVRDTNEPRQPQASADPRRWTALAVVALAQFMLILDLTVVNVALPDLGADLDLSRTAFTWTVSAYGLVFGGLLLLGGRLADIFGTRPIILTGLVIFTLASLVTGLAQNELLLLGGRVGQGLGAALLIPGRAGDHHQQLPRRGTQQGPEHMGLPRRRRLRRRSAHRWNPHRRSRLALGLLHQRPDRRRPAGGHPGCGATAPPGPRRRAPRCAGRGDGHRRHRLVHLRHGQRR